MHFISRKWKKAIPRDCESLFNMLIILARLCVLNTHSLVSYEGFCDKGETHLLNK